MYKSTCGCIQVFSLLAIMCLLVSVCHLLYRMFFFSIYINRYVRVCLSVFDNGGKSEIFCMFFFFSFFPKYFDEQWRQEILLGDLKKHMNLLWRFDRWTSQGHPSKFFSLVLCTRWNINHAEREIVVRHCLTSMALSNWSSLMKCIHASEMRYKSIRGTETRVDLDEMIY